MNKIWKYGVLPLGIVLFLLVVTVMLLPVLINIQRFVPEIEQCLSKAMGLPVSIGPDVAVSLFPSPNLTFSDLKIGNPPGFASEALVKIDSFEARIKLLPLLKREIRIARFVVGGLEINLEKNGGGKDNWRMARLSPPRLDFLQDNVFCSLLAVTDGRVNWIDRAGHVRYSVDKLMLLLNVQQDGRAVLDFKASYGGRPIALDGKIGPFRDAEGDQSLPLDVNFQFLETLQGRVQGKIEHWRTAPVYEVALNLSPFSPRQLFAAQGMPFPVEVADPATFQVAGLDLVVKGRRDGLTIEKGTARLDDTTMVFSAEAKNPAKPELGFSLAVDRLDLDRYLRGKDRQEPEAARVENASAMRALMHRLARDASWAGSLNIQTLKMYGITGAKVQAAVGARGGVVTFDPVSMQLYGGQFAGHLTADLTGELPRFTLAGQSQGFEAGILLRQITGRDFLTGTLTGDMTLEFSGNSTDERLASLTGQASFACLDGALLGVDLTRALTRRQMIKAERKKDDRTDFAELKGAMVIEDGRLTLHRATLASPALALSMSGGASVPGRVWNLQVAPQGEEANRKGKGKAILPLTITGTFEKADDRLGRQPAGETAAGTAKGALESLADDKMPPLQDGDIKGQAEQAPIDPAVVAQGLPLQRETSRQDEQNRQPSPGSGKIRINPLLEEATR